MTRSPGSIVKPHFLVCEDGSEYLERFERYLGAHFDFSPSSDFTTLVAELERGRAVSAILLDLDFRRADTSKLVDEFAQPLRAVNRAELAEYVAQQGIFILSSLRRRGFTHSVLLFADIDDPRQCRHLTHQFAPLHLVPSHIGLSELQNRLAALGGLDPS